MSQVTITCPDCGFTKNVDRGRIPVGAENIKCPRCRNSFRFRDMAESKLGERDESRPAGSGQGSYKNVPTPAALSNSGGNYAGGGAVTKFCSSCGQKIYARAEICPKCGVRVAPSAKAVNKLALLLITFFLGGLGAHKFYQRKYLAGTLYLLFFWTYIPTIIALVEFFIYLFQSEPELQERYPEASSGAIVFAVIIPFIFVGMIGILAAIAIPQFAAYRGKAYNAAASSDLQDCRGKAEAYFYDHDAYPTEPGQFSCQTSKGVALYFVSFGPQEYQIISFHDCGTKAFMCYGSDEEIHENDREDTEENLEGKFGSGALERTFHFF